MTSPAEQPEVIQAETLRNIGCCGLAAATTGRQHFGSCANWEPLCLAERSPWSACFLATGHEGDHVWSYNGSV